MGLDNEDDDLVGKITRDVKARTDANLLGLSLGDRTLTDKGLMNIGRAVFVENKRQDDKKKKEEKERSEALKRVQEALEKHLAAIYEEIEKHRKAIEAIGELREKIRNGTFNKDDKDTRSLLNRAGIDPADISDDPQKAMDKLDRVQTEREKEIQKLEKEAETLRDNFEKAETPEERQAVVADAKAVTLRFTRTQEDTKGPNASGLTLSETANPLQEKMKDGDEGLDKIRTAEMNSLASSGFLAANMEGDGTYTKGIGEKGLTSQIAFNNASSISQEENNRPKLETEIEHNETPAAKAVPSFTG
ncbi:MAG TPA: hypothetical protein DEA55_05310 [Rhodospirillaceae bacterium]|nr:hypothetical protein [Rhodospirillaceae bacterium]